MGAVWAFAGLAALLRCCNASHARMVAWGFCECRKDVADDPCPCSSYPENPNTAKVVTLRAAEAAQT